MSDSTVWDGRAARDERTGRPESTERPEKERPEKDQPEKDQPEKDQPEKDQPEQDRERVEAQERAESMDAFDALVPPEPTPTDDGTVGHDHPTDDHTDDQTVLVDDFDLLITSVSLDPTTGHLAMAEGPAGLVDVLGAAGEPLGDQAPELLGPAPFTGRLPDEDPGDQGENDQGKDDQGKGAWFDETETSLDATLDTISSDDLILAFAEDEVASLFGDRATVDGRSDHTMSFAEELASDVTPDRPDRLDFEI